MIIIVEGVDRVGKSIFCRDLSKVTGYALFEDNFLYSVTKKSASEKIITSLNLFKSLLDVNQGVVVNKFHLTELVYGYKDRGYDNSSFIFSIDSELSSLDSYLIFIKSEDIKKSSQESGKDLDEYEKMLGGAYLRSKMKKNITNLSNFNHICAIVDLSIKSRMERK